ncbi:MAG: cell division protein FtsK [Zetaproteobacteria bacterium CG_4_9_14_3_um_filter_49_83]|nr:MAG: cell division protein FtsK [Zetaproteobacteria bacterium CG1_02_49_23]PIQ33558.1 MAG: cell division protein FtsK [Zetaproteobacteria bacterium CG17_big_fil_post_rev_8_21_14_2_50_50_13]PIV29776.1 MAG: cell division protein FtsK [Zetaproteobacteria bacterium CG02_land_8_20_14_3_00_50_9]PIY56540.1 MAG: cell division protein FtsK [Zetaproteobacteria bacterium CG_4_10_14_0_8_um_filter_49_80]PJA33722.1 MAG: cell division protein FtsK [Zetaproteobacteria bacterium CG_4_9_14_3_um_filter_49_83]
MTADNSTGTQVSSSRSLLLVRESLAMVAFSCVLMLSMSLYSFAPADPSFNQTSDAEVQNILGIVGAYLSDFLYQLFGYGGWLVVFLAMLWVVRFALNKAPYSGGWSSLFWLPMLLALAGLLHLSGVSVEAWGFPAGPGGAMGKLLSDALIQPMHEAGAILVLVTMLISSLIIASHISLLTLTQRTGFMILALLHALGHSLSCVRAFFQQRRERLEVREVRQKEKQKRTIIEAEKIEPEILPVARVEVSQRARKEQQVELPLAVEGRTGFRLPSLGIFKKNPERGHAYSGDTLQAMSKMLENKLMDYRVEGAVVSVQPGPVVVQFEFEPAPGTKVARIISLQDDLARSISAISVRVAGNIPGKNTIGIEIPNETREMVQLSDVLSSHTFTDKKKSIPMALGVDIAGQAVVVDLAKMPHLLVAGTTGSGKSVSVNTMICSMLMTHSPETLRLIMVDPKMLELSMYEDIPHLLVPVVTSPHKATKALAWAVFEMERRYKEMSEAKVRNLEGYNRLAAKDPDMEALPLIVILIDELADLMMVAGKEVEQSICRIAQKARAAGIHLILATQRPSVDVITGLIKANLPSRLAFQVSSKIDSRTILDQMGAEQLLGQGDSLLLSGGRDLKRVHGAFVSDEEVLELVEHLRKQGPPDYQDHVFEAPGLDEQLSGMAGGGQDRDEKYDEAAELVIEKGKCSVSMVQRYLSVGYNRASRIVEQMEEEGLVTAPGAGGIRKVLARSQADGGGGVIE